MTLRSALLLALCAASSCLAQEISMEERAKKQCRSVHLFHEDIPANSKALFVEVKPTKTAPGTYFCAATFDDGYIGFQDIPGENNNAVIFSVWDPVAHGDNPEDVPEEQRTGLVKANRKAEVSRFGGEGTGGKSMIRYEWKIDEPMKFVILLKPVDETFKEISGYFFNNHENKWELISRWKTHRSKRELSQATSFVEDFRRNYESTKYTRSAEFGPYYAMDSSGKWHRSKQVTFCADQTPSNHISARIIDKKQSIFMLSTGGESELASDFALEQRLNLPDQDADDAPSQYLDDLLGCIDNEEA